MFFYEYTNPQIRKKYAGLFLFLFFQFID